MALKGTFRHFQQLSTFASRELIDRSILAAGSYKLSRPLSNCLVVGRVNANTLALWGRSTYRVHQCSLQLAQICGGVDSVLATLWGFLKRSIPEEPCSPRFRFAKSDHSDANDAGGVDSDYWEKLISPASSIAWTISMALWSSKLLDLSMT